MPQNLRFRRGTTSERGGALLYGEPYVNIETNNLEVGGLNDTILIYGTGSNNSTGVGFPFSGSAIITGSLFVSNSLSTGTTFTASLQQGYVWVGGANNISYLVATSSLGTSTTSGLGIKPRTFALWSTRPPLIWFTTSNSLSTTTPKRNECATT